MRSIAYVFLCCVAALTMTACPSDDESDLPTIGTTDLVSATGQFNETSGELAISVSPKDEDGNFVGQGLPESAFSFEDVTIAPLGLASLHMDVTTTVSRVELNAPDLDARFKGVVIFDSSGSMSGNDPGAVGRRLGGKELFDVMRPGDELAVLDFGAGSTPPFLETRVIQDFTSDRALLDASLDALTEAGGTPLFESIVEGLTLLDDPAIDVPALVVLTDGQANGTLALSEAITEAQRLAVPIYAIGLGESLDYTLLAQLADETQGGFIEASDAMALEQAFRGVSSGLRLGNVVVHGEGTYELPVGYSRYTVAGNLVTTDGAGTRHVTPFSITIDID